MISQIALVNAICRALSAHGTPILLPRQMDVVIRAADDILEALRQPERVAPADCGLEAWLRSDQTGASSRFMAMVLSRRAIPGVKTAYPLDPSDFGRCLGLLDACPELRERLPDMTDTGPHWAALVAHWNELEALFHEEAPTGLCPRLYARMKELTGESA